MNRPTKFIIFAAPRTGSNMLCTLLNSHSQILCHHEIYNPTGVYCAQSLRNTFDLGSVLERDEDSIKFLDRVWKNHLSSSAIGFKMTHRQNLPVFQHLLQDTAVKKIILKRKNKVKTVVSKLVAEQTGRWEVYEGDKLPDNVQVHINITDLKEGIEFDEQYYQEIESTLKKTNQIYHTVFYDSLEESTNQLDLLGFLNEDLPIECLTTNSVKVNKRKLQQIIANYDELKTALKGTDLEQDLD